jgi:CRP-like cAMP-binding protein
MFVILDGQLEVIGSTAECPRVVLAKLSVGDCFGGISLLTSEPRNATVRAAGDVMVLEIRKSDLMPLVMESPCLTERLAELLEFRRKNWAEILNRAEEETTPGQSAPSALQRSLSHRIRVFFGQG